MQIAELEPRKVFHYFSEISKIPRGSGNTDAIARYCLSFAGERGLEAFRDDYGNVIIFKGGSGGGENSEPVMLQGHIDMVCEKEPDCARDMDREGVDIIVENGYLRADGTTLGGDDGIAVAYILALLDSDDIAHPPIEAVLTTDEEIGLRGAHNLDVSRLKGRRLINIDSEEEGKLTAGCAGGVRSVCRVPLTFARTDKNAVAARISIGGLLGGHSGIDIDKPRKNAAKVLSRLLYRLNKEIGVGIAALSAGGKLNVIPQAAEVTVCFDAADADRVADTVNGFNAELKRDCAATEPEAYAVSEAAEVPETVTDEAGTEKLIFALLECFDGVYAMNPSIPQLVQTSSNLGSAEVSDEALELGFMIRSNTAAGKRELAEGLSFLMEYLGGEARFEDDYPAWEYRADSPLRETMIKAYIDMYGEPPQVCTIHAGLECGIISEKLAEADMVSIGPDMEGVHTPGERLSVKSSERCWKYLLKVLEELI